MSTPLKLSGPCIGGSQLAMSRVCFGGVSVVVGLEEVLEVIHCRVPPHLAMSSSAMPHSSAFSPLFCSSVSEENHFFY